MPASPLPPAADPRGRSNVTSVRKPEPPGAPATPGTNFFQKKPAAPAPAPAPALVARIVPPAAKPAAPAAPAPLIAFAGLPQPSKPVSKPAVSTGNSNGNGNGFHAPAAPVESKGGEQAAIWVALDVIAETWPDELRLEIAQMNLGDAKLALPLEQVEAGLKSGKVSFTWKQVRAAIKPAIAPGISAYDGLQVNVPLSIIAPLFLARQKENNGGQKRVALDDKIPDLFFGFPQPEAVSAPEAAPGPVAPQPAAKPSDTNYFIWDDDRESAQGQPVLTPPRTGGTPGTTFATRKATPNQVVMKASMLEGVYGALVALPDGLPVACKLDPSQNADTIAALIPQMYSKLSGCTKELRMGELNNLNFTVGNVPWKIFRVNGIFFAAFGCAGEPLPTAQLAELAAELDYKKAQAQ